MKAEILIFKLIICLHAYLRLLDSVFISMTSSISGGTGTDADSIDVNLWLFAADIVFIASFENELHSLLDNTLQWIRSGEQHLIQRNVMAYTIDLSPSIILFRKSKSNQDGRFMQIPRYTRWTSRLAQSCKRALNPSAPASLAMYRGCGNQCDATQR